MALASVLCAALSLVCIVLALPATLIPGVGAVFAFCAPVLAFTGIVAGGVAIMRARRERAATGLALVGVLASLASLVPALFTAVTLGLLNLLFASAPLQVQRSFQLHVQSGGGDAGVAPAAPPPMPEPPPAPQKALPKGAPPPAFPPPLLPPGPTAPPPKST